jgi:hypothetical protein
VDEANRAVSQAIEMLYDALDETAEWDVETVSKLVLEHCDTAGATTQRRDGELVVTFSAQGYDFRYAVEVTTGNEWFHIKRNGDWDQVWRN